MEIYYQHAILMSNNILLEHLVKQLRISRNQIRLENSAYYLLFKSLNITESHNAWGWKWPPGDHLIQPP